MSLDFHRFNALHQARERPIDAKGFRMFRLFAGFVLAVMLSAGAAVAQATVAVSGVVRDASGGVLPGATVEVVVAGRAVATATAANDGRYQVQVPRGVPFELQLRPSGLAVAP